LLLEVLIGVHRQLAFLNHRHVDVLDVTQLIDNGFQIGILLLKFNIFLDNIRQLVVVRLLKLIKIISLNTS